MNNSFDELKSLISGVAIVRPEECIPWLIEKLEHLQSVGIKELKWYYKNIILKKIKKSENDLF